MELKTHTQFWTCINSWTRVQEMVLVFYKVPAVCLQRHPLHPTNRLIVITKNDFLVLSFSKGKKNSSKSHSHIEVKLQDFGHKS